MAQGVFTRAVLDAEELEELVARREGSVHLREKEHSGIHRFRPILTEEQMASREERDALIDALLGGSTPDESPLELGRVVAAMDRPGRPPIVAFVRPWTKKALREAVSESPADVFLEETSVAGNEFEGWLSDAPERSYHVVGPEPGRLRRWGAAIRWSAATERWIVE